jgi:uncharacterized protein YciI
MKDIRFVVIHTPGPAWNAALPFFEQEGLQDHVEHYRALLAAGKLSLGGPFLQGPVAGMMVPEPSLTEEEITEFAQADPAVAAGLLKAEVRPWLVGMKK